MIVRLTQRLKARIKVAELAPLPLHGNPLLDWSAHLFAVGRTPFIMMSHTTTLLSAVVPGRGVTSEPAFRAAALGAIAGCFERYGCGGDPRAVLPAGGPEFRYAKTLNRYALGQRPKGGFGAERWWQSSPILRTLSARFTAPSPTGPSRTVTVGRASPKNLAAAGLPSGLPLQALRKLSGEPVALEVVCPVPTTFVTRLRVIGKCVLEGRWVWHLAKLGSGVRFAPKRCFRHPD
jgi:hypothetical protein